MATNRLPGLPEDPREDDHAISDEQINDQQSPVPTNVLTDLGYDLDLTGQQPVPKNAREPHAYESVSKAVLDSETQIFFDIILTTLIRGAFVDEMEPLSPRPTNVPSKLKTAVNIVKGSKPKPPQTTSIAKLNRERNHPPAPPHHLQEPRWPEGEPGKRYAIKNLLGRGGFAICYEAEEVNGNDEPTGGIYAVKIVRRVHPQPKMMDKFKSELQIHSKMRHPNIVEFHRAFTNGESTHVVLGLCPNGSLMDMVRKRKFLTQPEVRRYIIQISGAIKYMHRRNIIHRDLKMGNIFLDKDMNVKIGDFGLAALLVTGDELKRRRTMCGTPNYIAPEILEKAKQGHDNKVDIWSLGVIIFAMLTGYPPFQAKTTDEIYKKVKNRDYHWPGAETRPAEISTHAKDLVRDLLVGAEERPEPDDIVAHPFLRSGIVLEDMPSSARYSEPAVPSLNALATMSEQDWWNSQWRSVCIRCGVGRPRAGKIFPRVGENQSISIYNECQDEEDAGRTPIVPLPENVAYIPFLNSAEKAARKERKLDMLELGQTETSTPAPSSISVPSVPDVFPTQRAGNAKDVKSQRKDGFAVPGPSSSRGQGPSERLQSATARETPAESSSQATPASQSSEPPKSKSELASQAPTQADSDAGASKRDSRLLSENPLRPLSSTTAASSRRPAPNTVRLTRSQTVRSELGQEKVELTEDRKPTRSTSTTTVRKASGGRLPNVLHKNPPLELAKKDQNELRLASQVEELVRDKKKSQRGPLPIRPRTKVTDRSPQTMLIDPREVAESLPYTKASEVNEQIGTIINSLRSALEDTSAKPIENMKRKPPPIVIKWVDYTNKFGIGYILSDGTIGCLFNAETTTPSTAIVVRGGEDHMKKKKLEAYTERHQIIPTSGQAVEFYENLADHGVKRVLVDPKEYEIKLGPDNTPGKLAAGASNYDSSKKRRVLLFNKFAQYMILGSSARSQDSTEAGNDDHDAPGCGAFVKFYQRLGDLGVWNFGDGSYQFNFPDHTKVILSRDGKYCDFYHLPEKAAKQLQKTGKLPESALDKRSLLSFPTQNLVKGVHGNKSFAGITTANEFRKKIAFIMDLMGAWLAHGGIGRTHLDSKIEWFGMREKKNPDQEEKLVWVTVGAYGGDRRFTSTRTAAPVAAGAT